MQSGGQSATSWASFLASWKDDASNCFTGDGAEWDNEHDEEEV